MEIGLCTHIGNARAGLEYDVIITSLEFGHFSQQLTIPACIYSTSPPPLGSLPTRSQRSSSNVQELHVHVYIQCMYSTSHMISHMTAHLSDSSFPSSFYSSLGDHSE